MALDFFQENMDLLADLDREGVAYAVAGAVALAIHGSPRATADLDLLILPQELAAALDVARRRGYTIEALPMRFADGVEMRRVTKLSGEDALTLDLLLVDDFLRPIWEKRIRVPTTRGELWVVTRDGLIQMKAAAGRPQDLADLARLQEDDR
jgi:hypothetical protein